MLSCDPAGDHDLDQVGTQLELAADSLAQLIRAVRLETAGRPVAVPARTDDRRAGRPDPRTLDLSAIDRVSDSEVGLRVLPDEPNGGDARMERLARVRRHAQCPRRRHFAGEVRHPRQDEPKMHVHIHEAGHEVRAAEIQGLGTVRTGHDVAAMTGCGNTAALDQQSAVGLTGVVGGVEDRAVEEQQAHARPLQCIRNRCCIDRRDKTTKSSNVFVVGRVRRRSPE